MGVTDEEKIVILVVIVIISFLVLIIAVMLVYSSPSEQWCNELNNKTWLLQQTDMGYVKFTAPNETFWCVRNESGWHLNTSQSGVCLAASHCTV